MSRLRLHQRIGRFTRALGLLSHSFDKWRFSRWAIIVISVVRVVVANCCVLFSFVDFFWLTRKYKENEDIRKIFKKFSIWLELVCDRGQWCRMKCFASEMNRKWFDRLSDWFGFYRDWWLGVCGVAQRIIRLECCEKLNAMENDRDRRR